MKASKEQGRMRSIANTTTYIKRKSENDEIFEERRSIKAKPFAGIPKPDDISFRASHTRATYKTKQSDSKCDGQRDGCKVLYNDVIMMTIYLRAEWRKKMRMMNVCMFISFLFLAVDIEPKAKAYYGYIIIHRKTFHINVLIYSARMQEE